MADRIVRGAACIAARAGRVLAAAATLLTLQQTDGSANEAARRALCQTEQCERELATRPKQAPQPPAAQPAPARKPVRIQTIQPQPMQPGEIPMFLPPGDFERPIQIVPGGYERAVPGIETGRPRRDDRLIRCGDDVGAAACAWKRFHDGHK
jgi:hypothetical protein